MPKPMANPVETIHINLKTAPTALASPQAIRSLENINPIIRENNTHRNQFDLINNGILFLKLTLDNNRSWKAPMGQSHPQ